MADCVLNPALVLYEAQHQCLFQTERHAQALQLHHCQFIVSRLQHAWSDFGNNKRDNDRRSGPHVTAH